MQFATQALSDDNPVGLVLTNCQFCEREEWLRRGFPDLWDQYRDPDRAREAAKRTAPPAAAAAAAAKGGR